MITLLIIIGLLCFTLLAILRRDWGIYFIILLLPTYQIRFSLGFMPMTFLECLILILAGTEFVHLIRKRLLKEALDKLIKNQPAISGLIILFLLAAAISVSTSPVTIKAAGIFKAYFLEASLFYFLVLLIIDNEKKLLLVWKSLGGLVLYLSVFGIYQFFTLENLPFSWWAVNVASRRITSLLNHPNAVALLLGPILAMLIMLPKKTKFFWLTIGLGIITLYLTFSRAAWLALLATVIGLPLITLLPGLGERTEKRSNRWLKILASAVAIILLIMLTPFSRTKILDLARGTDLAQQNRYVLWNAAFDMLKKSPILGVGLMGFHKYYKNYPLGPDRVVQNYPHNFFLNFWLETGLLGLASGLGLLILFFKKAYLLLQTNKWKGLGLAAAAGMGMILLHGMVDVSYFKNDLSILFWLVFALPNLTFFNKES